MGNYNYLGDVYRLRGSGGLPREKVGPFSVSKVGNFQYCHGWSKFQILVFSGAGLGRYWKIF